MTRYDYKDSYLYFDKDVTDVDLQVIVAKGCVRYCTYYECEELYLERHDKTRYKAIIILGNVDRIEIVEYTLNELDKKLQELIIPVWLMKEVYDSKTKQTA